MSVMVGDSMRRISRLLQSGQYHSAHSQLESLVTANPDYVEGLRLLAGTKQILGDVAHAEPLLRRALEIDPIWAPTLTAPEHAAGDDQRRACRKHRPERDFAGARDELAAA